MKPIDRLDDDELGTHVRAAFALRDAPPALLHAAIALWRAPAPGILRRLLATLAFDSARPAGAMLAARSGRSTVRQLLFNTEGRDIDLRIAPHDGAWALVGQVLGPDDAGRIDVVAGDTQLAGSAALNALGEFRIDGIAAGSYRVVLTLGGDEITLPPVDVGTTA